MTRNDHKTQITIAIIGVIGVLGAAVITNWDRIFPQRVPDHVNGNGTEQQSAPLTGSGDLNQQKSAASECLNRFFAGLPKDRIVTLEVGSRDAQVVGPHQSREQAIGLLLTEDKQPIGAIRFEFFSGSTLFKIRSVVSKSVLWSISNVSRLKSIAMQPAAETSMCCKTGTICSCALPDPISPSGLVTIRASLMRAL